MAEQDISLGDRKIVQQLLEQRKQETLFMNWVDKVEKTKKEKRILIIATDRIFSLRAGGKIAREGHFLELTEITSPKPNEVNMSFKAFKLNIVSELADEIINAIRTAFATAFPGLDLPFKLEVSPSSRLRDLDVPEQPLGGFINTYKSLCNLHGVEIRDDICWDMENLFVPGNIKEFNLREFEQPISFNDFKALLGALQHNKYFRTLVAKEYALDKNMNQCVADVLKTNNKIEELILVRLGLNKENMGIICDSLSANKTIALTSVNLSFNSLEDKGMQAVAGWIGNLNRGLVRLNVSNCNAGKLGTSALCSALKKNVHMSSTLLFFDISHNKLEADGSSALASFLANPNGLKTLSLGNTNANVDILLSAIVRGCNELQSLDVSFNKLTKKEIPTLVKFLTATATLTTLDLSSTATPAECIKDVLAAIGGNAYLKDCNIRLADNKWGVPGARVIASLGDKINNISNLDLADNDLGDEGLGIISEGLRYNSSIKHLVLDRNYKGKAKTKSNFIDGLIALLSSDCPLETLSIAGGPKAELKTDILPLLAVLGTNETLKSLDVSGNLLGNKGASALGKMLQTNDTLTTLKWDNNMTGISGFISFNFGLKRNYTLKVMPLPIIDISTALKEASNPNALTDIINKIESNISRNQSPTAKFQKEGQSVESSGSQFAFLTSGQREEVQKSLFKIKSTGRKVADDKKIVVEDASNQDQIMTNIFSLKDQFATSLEHELKQKLIEFVQNAYPIYGSIKEKLIEQIIDLVRKSYSCLDEETIRRLQPNLVFGGGKDLTIDDFERTFVEVAGVELTTKGTQGFHSVCSIASDYLYEKLQERLKDIADELSNEIALEQQQKEDALRTSFMKEGNTASGSAPPPKKPPPAAPVTKKPSVEKKPEVPKKPPKPGKGKGKEDEVHIEALPKVESNLTHATKERPQIQQKRKPPTRKPRPVHNPENKN